MKNEMYIACPKCKYNHNEQCEFYLMGSGNEIDMPCYREREPIKEAATNFIQAYEEAFNNGLKGELPKHTNSLQTKIDNRVKPYRKVNAIIIPDNATNGDMIKAMFPNCRVFEGDSMSSITIDGSPKIFGNSWWNAPYKTESEKD